MQLHTINTELFKLDGGAMFGVVPKTIWQKKYPSDENNLCVWAMRCLLVEDASRLILIDTGLGNKQNKKFFNHYFLHGGDTLQNSLKKIGVQSFDITDVILTHLHFDHAGGAVDRIEDTYKTAFPNATYWSNQTHWHCAIEPNEREKASFLKENILPIQESGQLKFVPEEQNFKFSENIKIKFFNGHTKSLMVPLINHNNQTLAFVADLLPSIGHIPLPYVAGYDIEPLVSMTEKKMFLQEALDHNYTLFFEHEPFIECCNLKMTDKGIRENKCFSLSEFLVL